jgi:hypothetical protein
MQIESILELLKKERGYEIKTFGSYDNYRSFNVMSFLTFIEEYITKCKHAYSSKWERSLPDWLLECKEISEQGTAPIEVYENLIKIMTLAAAALETYTQIDVEEWRKNLEPKEKWLERKEGV